MINWKLSSNDPDQPDFFDEEWESEALDCADFSYKELQELEYEKRVRP